MDNEVVINVVSNNHVKPGFDAARAEAHKAALDIEKDFKSSGEKAGKELGDGVSKGVKSGGSDLKKVGEKAGTDLSSGIVSKLKAGAPLAQGALIGIGAGAAPFLGAVISGAIIGGAGIGGVVGGAMIAAQDPGVQRSFQALGQRVSQSLKIDAAPMVKPLLGAIQIVQDSFSRLNPIISNIFSKSADFVAPLTVGITHMIEGIADGVNNLVDNAGPTIAAFGELFGNLGDSIGSALTTISGDSEDATDAIQDLGSILSFLIETVGYTIRGLTELYGALNDIGAAAVDMERAIGNLPEQQSELGSFMRHTAGAARDQKEAFQELADEMQAQTDPLFALIKGQRDVTKAQNTYNEALKKHGKNSAAAKDAMADLGKKALDLNGKVGAAAGGFNGRLTPAMKTALKNAKLTDAQINALEKQLRTAADAANAWSGTYKQTYITSFATFGKPYSQDGIDRGQVGGLATGGIKGAAAAPISSGLTWVGEQGPELVKLPAGTAVHSAVDSKRIAFTPGHQIGTIPSKSTYKMPGGGTPAYQTGGGGSSGSYGGGSSGSDGTITINLILDGKNLTMALIDPMRNFVRTTAGGSVQVAYGTGS
jgi:hypothetical protein